jgi:predicted membrane protein
VTLDLSRWQFAITTIFHFIFVPLTIGLALLLAIMQTTAYRNRRDPEKFEKWSKMTLFWRRLFLINFAIAKSILYITHRVEETTAFDTVVELRGGRTFTHQPDRGE